MGFDGYRLFRKGFLMVSGLLALPGTWGGIPCQGLVDAAAIARERREMCPAHFTNLTQALFSSPSCMRRPQLSLNRKIGQKVCCRRVPIIQPPSLHALVQSLLHKYLPLLRDACGEILGQRHATKEPSKRACEIAGLDILANMLGK